MFVVAEIMFVVMIVVEFLWLRLARGQFRFSKSPFRLPSIFSFETGLVALGGDDFADGGPAAPVTSSCVIDGGRGSVIPLGDLEFLCNGLLEWFSDDTGVPAG